MSNIKEFIFAVVDEDTRKIRKILKQGFDVHELIYANDTKKPERIIDIIARNKSIVSLKAILDFYLHFYSANVINTLDETVNSIL